MPGRTSYSPSTPQNVDINLPLSSDLILFLFLAFLELNCMLDSPSKVVFPVKVCSYVQKQVQTLQVPGWRDSFNSDVLLTYQSIVIKCTDNISVHIKNENKKGECCLVRKKEKDKKRVRNYTIVRQLAGMMTHPPAAAACRQVLPKSSGVSMSNPAQICNQHQLRCQLGDSSGKNGVSMNVPEDSSFLQQSEKPLRAARCRGNIP